VSVARFPGLDKYLCRVTLPSILKFVRELADVLQDEGHLPGLASDGARGGRRTRHHEPGSAGPLVASAACFENRAANERRRPASRAAAGALREVGDTIRPASAPSPGKRAAVIRCRMMNTGHSFRQAALLPDDRRYFVTTEQLTSKSS